MSSRMTGEQFFEAAKALEKNKEMFLTKRPGQEEAAVMLSAICGFRVCSSAMTRICIRTGISWDSPRKAGNSCTDKKLIDERRYGHATRTLAVALMDLYVKLGDTPPKSLADLYCTVTGNGVRLGLVPNVQSDAG